MTVLKKFLLTLTAIILFIAIGIFILTYSPGLPGTTRKTINTPTSIGTTTEIPYAKDKLLPVYGFSNIENLTISPDGTRAAFKQGSVFSNGGGVHVFVDNAHFGPFKDYDYVSTFKFTPDSSALMFVSGEDTKPGPGHLPINPVGSKLYVKQRNAENFSISPPAQSEQERYLNSIYTPNDFLADQSTTVPFGQATEYKVTLDTQITAKIETIRPGCSGTEICLPSKRRLVIEKNGIQYIHPTITASQWSNSGLIINPILSNNKKAVAYITSTKGSVVMVSNIDGENTTYGHEYDGIITDSLRFSDDSKYIGYGAHRDQKIYWIVEKVEE